jgi:probable addiction module antidote protein
MPKRTGDFNAWRLGKLSDPQNAANYLNAALEHTPELFLDAVKDVVQARKVSLVAKQAGVSRESIYRTFSATGNPTLDTFTSVLRALDVEISGFRARGVANSATPVPETGGVRSVRRGRRRKSATRVNSLQLSFTYDQNPLVTADATPAVVAFVAVPTTNLGVGMCIERQISSGAIRSVDEPTYVSAQPGFYGYIASNQPPALANGIR